MPDFQQCTRSHSFPTPAGSRAALHAVSLALVRSVSPPRRGVRLVGFTLSNFGETGARLDEPSLLAESDAAA